MAELYFAYGSNLHLEQFGWRCPLSTPVGRLTLPNYRLVFRGVADIVPAPGFNVEGAIYQITADCERALDRYEGFVPSGRGLYRKEYVPIKIDKGRRRVERELMFYVMNSTDISVPSQGYFHTIRQGFDDWSIDHATLNSALADAVAHEAAQDRAGRRKGQRRAVA